MGAVSFARRRLCRFEFETHRGSIERLERDAQEVPYLAFFYDITGERLDR